jgi:RNA polymerase sigma-32 factor
MTGDESDREASALPVPAAPTLPAPSVEPGLGRVDSLTRYMSQLREYPPITREQEQELARRWVEQHDPEAARRLVLSNLRLVVKIAMEYRRAWANTLDLIQEGNVGLLQAVQRFDPYQEVKLSTYAAYWIRAFILKYLIDNIRLVRLGSTRAERKLFFRLNKEKRELQRLGYEATPKLIAERLDVTEGDVVSMEQRLAGSDLSMDMPVGDEDGGARFGDFIAAPGDSAEQQVADEDLKRTFMTHVKAFADHLKPREQRIMQARVLADEPLTLQELGDEMGLTRERIRQIEKGLVDDLRDYLREKVVDFAYYAPSED